jgi:hypothetical protein
MDLKHLQNSAKNGIMQEKNGDKGNADRTNANGECRTNHAGKP